MDNCDISVVVCCYNSAERITTTFSHLCAQVVPAALRWEVVLVDNNCTDETVAYAYALWERNEVPLRVLVEAREGLTYARKCGVSNSSGEYIVFCDDDNWLPPNYLSKAFELITAHPEVGAIGGIGEAIPGTLLPGWFQRYQGLFACGQKFLTSAGFVNYVSGAGLVLRRLAYRELVHAGYMGVLTDRVKTSLSSGGDQELCYALRVVGWKILFDSTLEFKHYLPASRLTEEYLLRLAHGMGSSIPILREYARRLGDPHDGKRNVVKAMLPVEIFAAWSIARMLLLRYRNNTGWSLEERVAQAKIVGSGLAYLTLIQTGTLRQVGREVETMRARAITSARR